MENKKLNKKLGSLFWYTLYALPLITFLIGFISYLFIFKGTGFLPEENVFSSMVEALNSIFKDTLFPFIHNALVRVCVLLGNDMTSEIGILLMIILTWFIQTMLLHVIVDVLTFIFDLFHKLMEKVV